ncbi:hypothetical protein, partial [Microcoleus anatoxicus]|uniref:hypothetical protein n=1 Tax=Microcoleus anatoxicus TaxID=2705319 RepID=UPI0030C95F57
QEWSQSRIYRYMGKEGKKMIMSHTWDASIVHLEGTLRTLIQTPAKMYIEKFNWQSNPGISLSYQIPKLLTGQKSWRRIFSNVRRSPLIFFTDLTLLLISGVYLLGVTAALLSSKFLKNRAMIMLVSIAAYFLAVSGGVAGGYRFRLTIMPIICLLAGYGLWLIVDKIQPKNIQE